MVLGALFAEYLVLDQQLRSCRDVICKFRIIWHRNCRIICHPFNASINSDYWHQKSCSRPTLPVVTCNSPDIHWLGLSCVMSGLSGSTTSITRLVLPRVNDGTALFLPRRIEGCEDYCPHTNADVAPLGNFSDPEASPR